MTDEASEVVEVPTSAVFAERLRKARTDRRWTAAKLAALCGVSKCYITNLEMLYSSPSFELAKRLSKALGVTLDWLVGFDNDDQTELMRLRQQLFQLNALIEQASTIVGNPKRPQAEIPRWVVEYKTKVT